MAYYFLGKMYTNGHGVLQDNFLAFNYYLEAAGLGFVPAQYSLGGLYSNGRGVPVDNVQAYAWFSVSGANGYELGQKSRDEVSINMTPSAIEKGQQLADEIRLHLGT